MNLDMRIFVKIFQFEATSNFINFEYTKKVNHNIIDDRNNN